MPAPRTVARSSGSIALDGGRALHPAPVDQVAGGAVLPRTITSKGSSILYASAPM